MKKDEKFKIEKRDKEKEKDIKLCQNMLDSGELPGFSILPIISFTNVCVAVKEKILKRQRVD